MQSVSEFLYILFMSRRRLRRIKAAQARSQAWAATRVDGDPVRWTTDRVIRLAYTRSQAAEALGASRSTFVRRVLPIVETVVMPWGAILVPADELERLVAEHRQPAVRKPDPPASRGRPVAVPEAVVARIHHLRSEGLSFARIAALLDADGVPTCHGGERWWPSTVRFVLGRSTSADVL